MNCVSKSHLYFWKNRFWASEVNIDFEHFLANDCDDPHAEICEEIPWVNIHLLKPPTGSLLDIGRWSNPCLCPFTGPSLGNWSINRSQTSYSWDIGDDILGMLSRSYKSEPICQNRKFFIGILPTGSMYTYPRDCWGPKGLTKPLVVEDAAPF